MGEVHMTCGCTAKGDEWLEAWWWGDGEGLSSGCLCKRHARLFGAVQAKDPAEAVRNLAILETIRNWMEMLDVRAYDGIPYGFTPEQIDYYAPILVEELVRRMND